jgi:hypothetical protein
MFISEIKSRLITNVKNQRVPTTYTDDEYLEFAILGCKRFYIDIGREASWDSEYSDSDNSLTSDLNILQKDYCLLSSEIEYFKSIRNYWNTMISYTTNALSVAYAYKPFEFLEKTINEKENRLIDLFHKMTDVANMTSISDIDVNPVDYSYEG